MAAFFASPCWPIETAAGLLVIAVIALICQAIDNRFSRRRAIKRRLDWGE